MNYDYYYEDVTELYHHGIKGQKWYERRFQNPDGSLTPLGRIRYGVGEIKKKIPTVVVVKNRPKKETITGDPKDISKSKLRDHLAKLVGHKIHDEKPKQEEQELEEPKRPMTAEEKTELIRSGDANKLLSNYQELDRQELLDAIQRVRDVDTINQLQSARDQKDSSKVDERDEKIKQKILRSGDVNLLLANQDKFTRNELNDAILRSADLKKLNEAVAQEKKENNIVYKALNFTSTVVDKLDTYKGMYDKVKKWIDGDDDDAVYNMDPTTLMSSLSSLSKNRLAIAVDRMNKIKNVTDSAKSIGLMVSQSKIQGKSIGDLLKMAVDPSTDNDTLKDIAGRFSSLGQIGDATNKITGNNAKDVGVISNLLKELKGESDQNQNGNQQQGSGNQSQNNQQQTTQSNGEQSGGKKNKEKQTTQSSDSNQQQTTQTNDSSSAQTQSSDTSTTVESSWKTRNIPTSSQVSSNNRARSLSSVLRDLDNEYPGGKYDLKKDSADKIKDIWAKVDSKKNKKNKKNKQPADEAEWKRIIEVVKGDTFTIPSTPPKEEHGRRVVEALIDTEDFNQQYVYDWVDG